jgi:hypothetical protein
MICDILLFKTHGPFRESAETTKAASKPATSRFENPDSEPAHQMASLNQNRNRRKLSRDAADIQSMFTRNQIHEIHRAERLFASRHNSVDSIACACACIGIIREREQRPSEAVLARAHAMLAVDGLGWIKDCERL